jgi:hypothetical protein
MPLSLPMVFDELNYHVNLKYVNRNFLHSLQLQAVCLSDMTFTHITTGHPGSVHDARVLRQSDLWDNGLLVCNMTYHIIADGAYPLRNIWASLTLKFIKKNVRSYSVEFEAAILLFGNRSKRPHYQNAPTFYQNALTFYQNAPLFSKIYYNKKKKINFKLSAYLTWLLHI